MNKITEKDTPISVIIPNYNGSKTIHKCIQSILNNNYKNFELLVVDDCSEDSSVSIIKSFKDPRMKLLRNKKNSGPSKTRNKGIRTSKGEIILLIDSDAWVKEDWISQHVLAHKDIDIDIIAGSVQGLHKTMIGQADDFCNWWTSIPLSKSKFVKKLHVPTINLSIKRDVFSKIGYFKDELRYGEDSEFSNRAIKNQLKIYFKSDIMVYHFDRDSLKSFLKHNYNWGLFTIKNRISHGMEYNWLLPKNYFISWLYIIPLAFLFTCFIISKWILFKPKVIIYSPIILLGKIIQTIGIKDSLCFKNNILK